MEDWEYLRVKREVRRLLRFDLSAYKEKQVRRRLQAYLARTASPSWSSYLRLLDGDQEEQRRFSDYLTINVSSFFRDPDRWEQVRRELLPACLGQRARLRVWSAGCSVGAEVFSAAILLDELTPVRRHELLATDLDEDALGTARTGGPYVPRMLESLTPERRSRYFTVTPEGQPRVIRSLVQRVIFARHNLLSDPFPDDFDLILCRNVAIYFTEPAKEGLYRRLAACLRPEGFLFVGGTEIVSNPAAAGLKHLGGPFYQKGCEP